MKQYQAIKAKYPDAILLFRVGDFYEALGEDAVKTANNIGTVLTKRTNPDGTVTELTGFTYHSLDNYLPKLVRAGYRVAICDQLETPPPPTFKRKTISREHSLAQERTNQFNTIEN